MARHRQEYVVRSRELSAAYVRRSVLHAAAVSPNIQCPLPPLASCQGPASLLACMHGGVSPIVEETRLLAGDDRWPQVAYGAACMQAGARGWAAACTADRFVSCYATLPKMYACMGQEAGGPSPTCDAATAKA